MPLVKFEVTVKNAKPGDRVFVVGDPAEIGNWQMSSATELHTLQGLFPLWKAEVQIEAEAFPYKYVWLHSNGWEMGGGAVYYADAHWAQQQFFNVYADISKLGDVASAQAEDSALLREEWKGVQQQFALAHEDLLEMRNALGKQAEDLAIQGEDVKSVQQQFALAKVNLAELQNTLSRESKDLEHQREFAKGVQQQLELAQADLKEMRRAVVKQAEDLVHHRGLIREQDAVLQQQREVIQGQDALLKNLQAEMELEKRSTEKLRRELRDFRAIAPKAEELKEEVLRKIQEDIQKMLGSCEDTAGIYPDAPTEEEHVPQASDRLQGGNEPSGPPRPPVEVQADVRADVRSDKQPDHSPNKHASTVKPKLWAESINFEHPPHPEGEANKLTKEVLQTLMSSWTCTQEEKRKLLKTVQTRLHPDKPGGSTDAMNWFQAWKDYHQAWFLKGPQTNLSDYRQQPAG